MPPAWTDLAERIAATYESSDTAPAIILGPAATVVPDAIVVRPDNPWMSRGTEGNPPRFGQSQMERYVAVCATRIADPLSALAELYAMASHVQLAASDAGWNWDDVSAMSLDETTDTPLFVSTVRVTFRS